MKTHEIKGFKVIGISVRTTNENAQAGKDIPQLWHQWMSNGLQEKVPNKTDHNLYCIYTEYESDHTRPYTTILGCKVSALDEIPEGMTGIEIPDGNYTKQTAVGKVETAVIAEWQKIWGMDLPRIYTADFELYDERSFHPQNAEVDIYLSVK